MRYLGDKLYICKQSFFGQDERASLVQFLKEFLQKRQKLLKVCPSSLSKRMINNVIQCWMVDNCVEIINETVLVRHLEELVLFYRYNYISIVFQSKSFLSNSISTKYFKVKKTLVVTRVSILERIIHKLGEHLKQSSKEYEAKKSFVKLRIKHF
jgi:replicative DNA helicase